MKFLRGYFRLSLIGLALGFLAPLIVLTAWIPLYIRKVRLSAWFTTLFARIVFFLIGARFHCPEPDRYRRHKGFIFPNHVTYFDILALLYLVPVRFLAKAEVRSMPLIGMVGESIGCVWVQREDKASRQAARDQLAAIERYPPVALFPEGKRGPGGELLPLRYGAFEIVTQGAVPVLPAVILYDNPEAAIWPRGESIIKALWRLAGRSGRLNVYLLPLDTIYPQPSDDAVQLAEQTHELMTAVYTTEQTKLEQP